MTDDNYFFITRKNYLLDLVHWTSADISRRPGLSQLSLINNAEYPIIDKIEIYDENLITRQKY